MNVNSARQAAETGALVASAPRNAAVMSPSRMKGRFDTLIGNEKYPSFS